MQMFGLSEVLDQLAKENCVSLWICVDEGGWICVDEGRF